MKSLIYTILLFANLALVSGCTIEDKESKDNIQKQQTTAKPQIAVEVRDLSIQTHFVGLNFNEYQVHISWPQVPGQIRISSQLQILAVVPAESGVFIHEGQKSAEKINYLLEHLTLDGRIVASIPVSVQTPKDLLLHGDWKLSKDETLEAQRVFLAKGTTITVFDKSFSILAQELISEGALIQSYAEGDQAAVGVHGRAGGTVTISAITARGDLVVQLKGQRGGNGVDGRRRSRGVGECPGKNGANGGKSGNLNLALEDSRAFHLTATNHPGEPGLAGRRSMPQGTIECGLADPEGVDGKPGGPGKVCIKMSAESARICR